MAAWSQSILIVTDMGRSIAHHPACTSASETRHTKGAHVTVACAPLAVPSPSRPPDMNREGDLTRLHTSQSARCPYPRRGMPRHNHATRESEIYTDTGTTTTGAIT